MSLFHERNREITLEPTETPPFPPPFPFLFSLLFVHRNPSTLSRAFNGIGKRQKGDKRRKVESESKRFFPPIQNQQNKLKTIKTRIMGVAVAGGNHPGRPICHLLLFLLLNLLFIIPGSESRRHHHTHPHQHEPRLHRSNHRRHRAELTG